jgi:hypothetical protein
MTRFLVWFDLFLGLVLVLVLDVCPNNSDFLIRDNSCNLWMIILKDWIPGQARLPGMTQVLGRAVR